MTRDQFVSLCFIALLLFVVWEIILIFAPFFKAIFWAAILAFGFYPVYSAIRKKLKPNDGLAAILTTGLIFLLVLPPIILIIINVAAQAIDLYQSAYGYVREGGPAQLIDQIRTIPWVERIEAKVFEWDPLKQQASDWILRFSRGVGNFVAGQVGNLTKNFLVLGLNIFLTTILIFVFLKDGERIYNFLYKIAPLEEKNKKSIFKQINDTFSAVIRGQLLTSFTQALAIGIIFWTLRLPVPILFAFLTFMTTLIPVAGAASVWVPMCLYLFTIRDNTTAIGLLLLGLAVSQIDNIMKPALIGEKTKLPYFLLFFGILGGLKLYGLVGIFLAPVMLSLFFALVKIYQEKYL